MIDLSKNTNPYFPDKKMKKFLKHNIKNINQYSEAHIEIENKKLKQLNITKENILITNGTLDAMNLIMNVYSNKKLGLFNPTFWGAKEIAKINNCIIIEKKLEIKEKYDYDKIDELAAKTDILYLCNCNNPTLNYIEKEKLIKIIKEHKECHFIIDETILIFDKKYEDKTMLKYVNKVNNITILISLSKILGISGLRTGLLITSKSQKTKYIKKQIPYSNNILSSIFIKKYLSKIFELKKQKTKIQKNFNYLIKKIEKSIIEKIINNNTSFILLKIKENIDYNELTKFIQENNIMVSDINNHYDIKEKYIRVSAGTKRQYKKLIKIIKKYTKQKGIKT